MDETRELVGDDRWTRRRLLQAGAGALVLSSPVLSALARSTSAGAAPPRAAIALGAFANPQNLPHPTFAQQAKALETLESLVNRRFRIMSTFVGWSEPFPNPGDEAARDAGRIPLVSWEGRRDLKAVAAGRYDGLLHERARACRAFGAPLYIRWGAEFNGEWNPCYGQPSEFAAAWRHVVRTFRAAGSTNVGWVWCPYATHGARRPAEQWHRYYPGDRYVDRVGMDGYNWGATRSWSMWRSFGEIFSKLYRDYAGRKPLMICEVGCAEVGGDKAAWIEEMGGDLIARFPAVRALVWFDAKKETDWRIDSSPGSLAAFQAVARRIA
jgi:hypothetical protein